MIEYTRHSWVVWNDEVSKCTIFSSIVQNIVQHNHDVVHHDNLVDLLVHSIYLCVIKLFMMKRGLWMGSERERCTFNCVMVFYKDKDYCMDYCSNMCDM